MMALSPEVLVALRPAQAEPAPPTTGLDEIVLGKAPTTDGTLKRPEYFAAGDVGDFQLHEAALLELEARPTKPPPIPSSCGATERYRARRARSSRSQCTWRTSRKIFL